MGKRPASLPILVSWSGGKDCAWVLHELRLSGESVAGLFWLSNGRGEKFRISREVLEAQAKALGLPLFAVMAPAGPSREEVVRRACREAAEAGADRIAFGHIRSRVRPRVEKRLEGTGLSGLFPLWGRDTRELAGEMIGSGLEAVLLTVDVRVLPSSMVGRRFDRKLVEEVVSRGVDACGEGGSFNTIAVAGPMFEAPLALDTEIVDVGQPMAHVVCRLRS